LGNVEVMMMGIRYNDKDGNDYGERSVEVWLNELRLSEFEESGGWASTGRVTARLADLGSLVVAGRTVSSGFGSIDKKVNQRAMADLTEINVSTNLDLGKFFPEKAKVKIPIYAGFAKSNSTPKYNPIDPDIEMKDALNRLDTKQQKDSLKMLALESTTRKSFNLTNVKVDKTSKSGVPKIYDPTNFAVTYSFNETSSRGTNTELNVDKNHRGLFSYNFNGRPNTFEPFKNSKALSRKSLQFIRDINISPMPSQIAFRADIMRRYNEVQLRNITNPNLIIQPTFNKDFLLNNYFDLRHNLTRSFQFDFSTQKTSRIDEPEGRINRADDDYTIKRDSILTNLMNLGRPTLYHHIINATYMVPINKLPGLDWTSLQATYRSMYDWQAGPLTDESVVLGNVIENSMQIQLNGQLNLVSLYNKVGYLNEINQKYGTSSRQTQRQQKQRTSAGQPSTNPNQANKEKEEEPPKIKEVKYKTDDVRLSANTAKSIFHKLGTIEVELEARDRKDSLVKGEVVVVNENRITFTPEKSASGVKFVVTGKVEVNKDLGKKMLAYTTRLLMSVRNISINYSTNEGTLLPGFMPQPVFFGSGSYTPKTDSFGNLGNATTAPGIPFLLGWQDDNFALKAAKNGWITTDSTLNSPFIMTRSEQLSLRANIEPFPDLRIDLNANRNYSERMSEFYNYDNSSGTFGAYDRSLRGNFTMSINSMSTSWGKMKKKGNDESIPVSRPFENLMNYREIIARRLADQRVPNSNPLNGPAYNPSETDPITGFPVGYGPTSPEVLVPSFIAAYSGQDPQKVSLSPFPSIKYMRPNWRITYEGVVSQSELLKKYLKTLSISHAYRSSYNVGAFVSNLNYIQENDGFSYVRNEVEKGVYGDFIAANDVGSVSISEQFSPLLNLEATFVNDFEARAEIKTSRNLALSFANNQIAEVLSRELIFGLGYRFTKMDLIIKTKKSQKTYSNDLNIRADLSFRSNNTILRKIVEENNQLTAGQTNITLKTTADYMLSDRFQVRLYFDKIINRPLVGSFNTSNTNFGVSFRFTLAQ
jgi:cell surface protein SprA